MPSRRPRRPRRPVSLDAIAEYDPGAVLTEPPEPPSHLSPAAKAEWRRLAPSLVALRTARGVDLCAFELLVNTLVHVQKAQTQLDEEGFTIPLKNGGCKTHPAVQIVEKGRAQTQRLLHELGMTPRGREGLPSGRWDGDLLLQ